MQIPVASSLDINGHIKLILRKSSNVNYLTSVSPQLSVEQILKASLKGLKKFIVT